MAAAVDATGAMLAITRRPGVAVPDVVAALVAAGARIRSVRETPASLEDAYLSLVRTDD
jgi:hypothetical protein